MGHSYLSRLLISVDGNPNTHLFTHSGLLVAKGYTRVVIGGRGPYVEFSDQQIVISNIRRAKGSHYYYDEWRTVDMENLKLYQQMATAGYADYVIGMWYADPFKLLDVTGAAIMSSEPIKDPEKFVSIFD